MDLDPAGASCSNVCVGEIVRTCECVYGGGRLTFIYRTVILLVVDSYMNVYFFTRYFIKLSSTLITEGLGLFAFSSE